MSASVSLHCMNETSGPTLATRVDYEDGTDGRGGVPYYVVAITAPVGSCTLFLSPAQFVEFRGAMLAALSDEDEAATMREPIQRTREGA